MASRTMKTWLIFQLAGCGEHEAEVVITYDATPGDPGSDVYPPCEATIEIEKIEHVAGTRFNMTWMIDAGFYSESELADLCMQDWIDAEEIERDYADEARAARMMGDF
jgi:hypothetical protein